MVKQKTPKFFEKVSDAFWQSNKNEADLSLNHSGNAQVIKDLVKLYNHIFIITRNWKYWYNI